MINLVDYAILASQPSSHFTRVRSPEHPPFAVFLRPAIANVYLPLRFTRKSTSTIFPVLQMNRYDDSTRLRYLRINPTLPRSACIFRKPYNERISSGISQRREMACNSKRRRHDQDLGPSVRCLGCVYPAFFLTHNIVHLLSTGRTIMERQVSSQNPAKGRI